MGRGQTSADTLLYGKTKPARRRAPAIATTAPPGTAGGTIKDLERAFEALTERGVTAVANVGCCIGCAAKELGLEHGETGDGDYAFWHDQDDQDAFGRLEEEVECFSCNGRGVLKCDECNGQGFWEEPTYPDLSEEIVCASCEGTGEIYCSDCVDGMRRVESSERASETLRTDLLIAFGGKNRQRTKEVGRIVVEELSKQGLLAEWNGDPDRRICVKAA